MTATTDVRRWLRTSRDPAIRHLAGDASADVLASPRVQTLLRFPDTHPYTKWWGTHWRLVALADLATPPGTGGLDDGVERELSWLTSPAHRRGIRTIAGLTRRCASQEGNAVYALSLLGFAGEPATRTLVDALLEWQWPDGGWNCDVREDARRSSFHETVTPAIGLAVFAETTGCEDARAAARDSAQLLLEHRLFRSTRTDEVIHPSWIKLHYPAYWHYDILQGLRLLELLGMLGDPRATEALDVVERSRRTDGRFSGPAWWSHRQPDAVDWGRGRDNEMLNLRAQLLLVADR
ncbi:hypothetical protein [Phytoactinopolyspora halotolerans]|uniref:Prenyltransferase n=1 Tax=Phytoactinopolyspora halotolerans TaxID=1981512 RepID=A0A6L9SH53_9ACTN|nr:hypothetical protein [Phytoactinopolyspora halotolerans]NEE04487.1 hypothetical protein [Phytoactinopolyspora halotolerans]